MASASRSGFVGLVGRPNVGKSTILNYYLGEYLSIVTPRPQTTRHRILGVMTRADAQVAFLDTPGFHQPKHALGRSMLGVAKAVIEEADVIVAVLDGRVGITPEDERVFAHLERAARRQTEGRSRPALLLAINKVDLVKKPKLLPLIDACATRRLFAECIPVSALTGDQMDVLLAQIIASLPEGPRWYEPGQPTDQPLRQRIGELIREQVLLLTRQEVPHAVGVLVDQITEKPRVVSIEATIVVERQGQKAILIGRHGAMLKEIGREARRQIERALGRKVYLGLWVKVVEGWRDDARLVQQFVYLNPR